MKVILDTNVIVSGIFFKGPPSEILVLWKKKKFKLIATHEILQEYKQVVDDLSTQFTDVDVSEIMAKITLNSILSFSITLPDKVCIDPDDDKFFAAAMASKCRIIVSGDKHLLSCSGFSGIEVIKPSDFLEKYLRTR